MRILLAIIFSTPLFSWAQCDQAISLQYKKVMSSAFAKNYEKCPVIIEATFFKTGYIPNYRVPKKLKKMFIFQCIENETDSGKDVMGNSIGDFFAIDLEKADLVLDLKRGDRLELSGTTFIHSYYGAQLSTFFVVDSLNTVIND